MDPKVEKKNVAGASGLMTYGAVYMMLGNCGSIPVAGMEFSPPAGMAL